MITYITIGYFWTLICINRGLELNYPVWNLGAPIGIFLNFLFWPISMIMGYYQEKKLPKQKIKWL
jgi:hypothetical protein